MSLPASSECNSIFHHYIAIRMMLLRWKARDPENEDLYEWALNDIATAWKGVYRLGVRKQLITTERESVSYAGFQNVDADLIPDYVAYSPYSDSRDR